MTVYILGAATLIVLILLVWRRSSPEFKRKSEQPKFQFLANLGLGSYRPRPSDSDTQPSTQKGKDEEDKP